MHEETAISFLTLFFGIIMSLIIDIFLADITLIIHTEYCMRAKSL